MAADTVRLHSDGPMQAGALLAAIQRNFGAVAELKVMRKKRNFALVTFATEAAAAAAAGVSGSVPADGSAASLAAAASWPAFNSLVYEQHALAAAGNSPADAGANSASLSVGGAGSTTVTVRIERTWPRASAPSSPSSASPRASER